MRQYGTVTDTARPDLSDYELADRYRREAGRSSCRGSRPWPASRSTSSGSTERNGLNTAAFISGYQGSPVGAFGDEVDRADPHRPRPADRQPTGGQRRARRDGRDGQPAGDDPRRLQVRRRPRHLVRQGARARPRQRRDPPRRVRRARPRTAASSPSSVTTRAPSRRPCRRRATRRWSTCTCRCCSPATPQEALDLGRHAVALSRACGIWSGLKIVTPVADGTGTIDVHPDRVVPILPEIEVDGKPYRPKPNGRLITPYTLDAEREFHEIRTRLAQAVRRRSTASTG